MHAKALIDALAEPGAGERVRELDRSGRLTAWLPELEAGRGFAQPELHAYDVFEHSLAALEAADAVLGPGSAGTAFRDALGWVDFERWLGRMVYGVPLPALVKLGALLHDLGKPATATVVEGRLRFPRHGPVGAELAEPRLAALGFSEAAAAFVARLIRFHLRPAELVRNWPLTDRAVRRFVRDLDGEVLALMVVNLADGWATQGPRYTREHFRRHCTFANAVLARAWAATEPGEHEAPLVTGDDLIAELGLSGGRLLGAVLTSVRDAQIEGRVRTRSEALELARSVLTSLGAAE
ncbi:HDIG domain-containing metalloprotein [Tepidiforma sp.]|uniref:HDIG domain-containing metalloprotein n=1 Tax=Tepidiforma sp. TaxID=2682230 RepID=UPI002ADD808D|nr:HDIG domain-containing metalloprotein [Tepidiforma sp.]